VRLLLDEHLAPLIAEQLRSQGADVVAVAEREQMRDLRDEPLLRVAMDEGRALVTNRVAHLGPIVERWGLAEQPHPGLVLIADTRRCRSRAGADDVIAVLRLLLQAHPNDDALVDQVRWLP
jgi:hypothetical protein